MLRVYWKHDHFNNCFSSFWNLYEMCKRIAFLNHCSQTNEQILNSNINLAYIYMIFLLTKIYPISIFSCQAAVKKNLMSTCPRLN